ncbi:MAG: sugar transferase [Terriglobales bacterium]
MTAQPATAAPASTAISVSPAWCHPLRLRRARVHRGWRCQWSAGERRLKRTFDLLVCLLLALPAGLLVVLAAVAVRCESAGPMFFSQPRLGVDGHPFRMWKLRTMVANARELKPQLAHLNELPWPDFKISHDPRVTCVGRFLRRTSVDELPQLWNVWRGEMSLVGPRPTSFGLDRYQLWHTERLTIPPGITGLWQITARAQCDFDQRLRLDLAYVRAWRFSLDLAILAATARTIFTGKGAK